ncbi:MAG: flagellar basal-body rod protein FlgF [Pseudomonadota bacterium]
MSDAITVSLSRQTGLLNELSVIANNIANANTEGYRTEAALFSEFVSTRADEPSVSMGALRAHFPVLDQGALIETGAVFDLAIDGDGWFAVNRGGEVLLTRAGRFQTDSDGQLVTPDGDPVLDDVGTPVQLPPNAIEVAVSSDGTVTADGLGVAQIGILMAEPEGLSRVSDNLWRNDGPVRFAEEARIRQGFLEGSNVSPVEEMARLIEVQRMYEAGANLGESEHDRILSLIEALGTRR